MHVTEFTLGNGMHFILMERHDAPVISFHTYIGAGAVDDPGGQTGLANLVSRAMLHGTESLGTRDWESERRAMAASEEAYGRLQAERNKGGTADAAKVGVLETQWRMTLEAADAWSDADAYTRVIEQNGGSNVTAKTTPDATDYGYTLPSNKAELWYLLESQRLTHPVFREFYKERDLALEEHKRNVEGKAAPRVEAAMLATAFQVYPYRNPPDGWPGDVANLGLADAQAFFAKYYVPENIVIAMVGDVYPSGATLLAQKYFGTIPARSAPAKRYTEEPPQAGPKTAVVGASPQGLMAIGYKRPDNRNRDDLVFDVIQTVLSGRDGILQTELVGKGIAQVASAVATFPAGRAPNLFLFLASPAAGHTLDEVQKGLNAILAQMQTRQLSAESLQRAKSHIRMNALRRLANNAEMAALLPTYYAEYGDWRQLFRELDDAGKVTAEAVENAALKYFGTASRTTVYLVQDIRTEATGIPGGQQ